MAEDPKQMNFAVLGSTGLRETGGFIYEEILNRLRGRNGVKTYTEMSENNSIVGAILFIIDMLVRQVEWRVEAAQVEEGDEEAALEQKKFLEGVLEDMSCTWEDFISEALSILPYGWAYFETVFKLRRGETDDPTTNSQFDDGRVGLRKLEIRSQDTLWQWVFDDEGSLRGLVQMDSYRPNAGAVFIPIEKALLLRTRSRKGNPEGKSLLRPAVRDWFFLKRFQEIEAIGIERDLAGMPIMEVPRELLIEDAAPADVALRRQLETMIQQVRVDERWGGLIPSELDHEGKPTQFKFRLQTTGGRRQINTNDIIKRYESRIAMVFLAEFIMVGMDRVGAQSADESKKNLFKLALETILNDMIAAPFNRFIVSRLMKLNGVPRELWPTVAPASLDSPDLDAMGNFVKSLSDAGLLTPTRALENKLLSDARLPTTPDEELALFDDPATPTPRQTIDQAVGVLSPEQIATVTDINRAVRSGETTADAGRQLMAAALGMSPDEVDRFLVVVDETSDVAAEPGDAATIRASIGGDVQREALNGAQVGSMVEILANVGSGVLPPESARAILAAAFPLVDAEIINQMVNPLVGRAPVTAPAAPTAPTAPTQTAADILGELAGEGG